MSCRTNRNVSKKLDIYGDCDQHFHKSRGHNQNQRTLQTINKNHADSKDTKKV